jgi:membrane-associated phospholipid phosphatase
LPSLRVAFNAVDLAVYRRVRLMAHAPDRVRWVRRYSRLGEHGAVWLGIGLLGAAGDAERRGRWVRATACVGAAYLISTSIKVAIGRRRPVIEDLPHLMLTPTGLSFPSSHSTSSFAAAQAYGRLLPRTPLLGAAGAMAFSRLYLGVHYPSDVAAGAALGTVLGLLGR